MRSLRWLLLAAMVLVAATVFGIYRDQRIVQKLNRRVPPPAVPSDTRASAVDWQWGESSNGNPLYRIIAKHMTQSSETDKAQLEDVELRIFQKDGKHYDRVRSPKAEFSTSTSKLYAPGEAEITLDIPI